MSDLFNAIADAEGAMLRVLELGAKANRTPPGMFQQMPFLNIVDLSGLCAGVRALQSLRKDIPYLVVDDA